MPATSGPQGALQQGSLTTLVTDLGLADTRIAVLHPNLLFRQWEAGDPGDIIGSGSFYFADPAMQEKSHAELGLTVLANPQLLDLNQWITQRLEPVDAAGWEKLPLGTVTYRPASPFESISVRGHKAVAFLDHSWDIVAGRVLVADGDRIISIVYTDFGDGAMKSAFSTVVASLDWTRSRQEAFGRNLAVDQPLKQQLEDILAQYPSPRQVAGSSVYLDPDGIPAPPSPFKLPWTSGLTRTCTQAIGGTFSHTCPGQMCYAYDFDMSIGSTVKASRGGTIAYSVGTFTQCGGPDYANLGNRVVINHSDGSATLYLHLNSVSVGVGSAVNQGQTIGYSGNTGWTAVANGQPCNPHLHFQTQTQGVWITNSTPTIFDEYPSIYLQAGGRYTSRNPN